MRRVHLQFTIGRLMAVVAVSALVFSPFAWVSPESRWPLLLEVLVVGGMFLIIASPYLIDWAGREKAVGPGNRRSHAGSRVLRRGGRLSWPRRSQK